MVEGQSCLSDTAASVSVCPNRAEHEQRTAEIVRLETQLNARVYALFDLTPAEIKIIEESTKYRYGEV